MVLPMASLAGMGMVSSCSNLLLMCDSSWSGDRARSDLGNGVGVLVLSLLVLVDDVKVSCVGKFLVAQS